jgi:hypothetical protein
MKILLHVVIHIILFLLVATKINAINTNYSNSSLDVMNEISEISGKIKSGEEVLSPLQYSQILDVANDRVSYFFHLNMMSIISMLYYVLAVCTFYIGVVVGKKSKS